MVALTGADWSAAGELTVRVSDNEGQPVANVAVFVEQAGVAIGATHEPASAVMDQRDVRFVPHILVVEKGAAVEFPNSDVVAHHVYSFSRPNNFVLPLYKGTPPAPASFEHDGVVILGCNIHDGMLAYVVVVDTSVFGITDENGFISLTVDDEASDFVVNIWSPRIRDAKGPITQRVSAVPNVSVTFNLKKSLRLAHVDKTGSVEWDEY